MFETRRQKILLGMVLALLGAVVLDQLVVSPLWGFLHNAEARIEALKAEIAEAERLVGSGQTLQQAAAALKRGLRPPTDQVHNEFRRYLEAQRGPDVEVTSSAKTAAADLPPPTRHLFLRRYLNDVVGNRGCPGRSP